MNMNFIKNGGPYFCSLYNARFPLALAAMLVITLLSATLIMMLKRQADYAHRRVRRSELLFELSQALTDAQN